MHNVTINGSACVELLVYRVNIKIKLNKQDVKIVRQVISKVARDQVGALVAPPVATKIKMGKHLANCAQRVHFNL